MREVEVADSDVAPVRGLSLSIARESYEGQGQGEEAGETAMDIPLDCSSMYRTVNSALRQHSLHLLEAGTASFALLFSSERCLLGLLRRRGTPSAAAAASPVAWRADRRPALPAATAASAAAGCRGACGTRAAFAAAAVAWRAALRGREPERILFPSAEEQQHHTAAPYPLKVCCRVPSLASHSFKSLVV